MLDDVRMADIMSGRYGEDEEISVHFTRQAEGFIGQMVCWLENVQRKDYMERDRGVLKRQIDELKEKAAEFVRRIKFLKTQKETMETRKNLLGDVTVNEENIASFGRRMDDST